VAQNGDGYVALEGTDTIRTKPKDRSHASFVALRDTNDDGRADLAVRVGTIGNTGIGLHNGFLFVDEGDRIVRYARADSQLVPVNREVVVEGIPVQHGHIAHNFAFGLDSSLYVNVGSSTNSCQRVDRQRESSGYDPCPELRMRGGIWKFDFRKLNQRFSATARHATGLRNVTALTVAADGKLYAVQHGIDQLHVNWPRVFSSPEYEDENPAEVMVQVDRGDDFGWPYCYYAFDRRRLVDSPEYGGDGSNVSQRCASAKQPLFVYPAHWAPMSLLFYSGKMFPPSYSGGAFIAFHGAFNRARHAEGGYRVVFQPMNIDGSAAAPFQTFASGFAGLRNPIARVDTAKHRPVGLATGPDGALFITDDSGGRVYRVTYRVSH
jgi:glucose/arabinose dehydrogenase